MKVELTQFGYPGDPDADTLTEENFGAWDNQLSATSCALKRSTAKVLGAWPRCKIQILLPSGTDLYRFWDDVIPESDPGARCDLFQPKGFDETLPDIADISVIPDAGFSPAQPVA
jgi:hypothetical protein